MEPQSIIRYTEQVAGEVAARLGHDPLSELMWWMKTAHQREAMVSEMYELSGFEHRLQPSAPGDAITVIRSAVLSIWAHEESHTRYLSTLRSDKGGATTGAAELQGTLEGWVTRSASNGSVLARLLIAVGAALGQAPEFARELQEMSLERLLRFCAELETTARMGYQRMLQLSTQVATQADANALLGPTFRFDIARILCEETFHEMAFHEMASWVEPDGSVSPDRSAEDCVQALHELCERNLTMAALQLSATQLGPRLESSGPPAEDSAWASDGGMGGLFAQYGLAVPLRPT